MSPREWPKFFNARFLHPRRRSNRSDSESEQLNVALLGALPDTMFLIDRNGAFVDFRRSSASAGGEAAGHSGKDLYDELAPDVTERLRESARRAISSGLMQTLEYTLLQDGSPRQYEARVSECGEERALVVIRDVSDRFQAEQTIREAESKFRILVEQSLTGIYVIQDDRFVYANPRIAQVFGYHPDELLGLDHFVEILLPDDRPLIRERIDEALRGERGSSHDTLRGVRKDGTVIYIEIFSSVIDFGGRPAIIGTVLDVTDQREAQESLRVLGMAVEQSAEGVLVIDTAGIVSFVNPAWARIHGYTVEEIKGRHFRIFHTEEQLRKDVFPVINRFETAGIYRAEMGHKRKDGSTFTSSTAFASLHDDDGRVIGAVGICRDITEQKQYEAELLAAKEQAEELSRMKTTFLTNMSHEIRTPLTGILGFAKVLEEELPDEQREFAHLIRVSGDRLLNTLNSILDLARLEAGELQLMPREVDLAHEVRDAASVFKVLAKEKRINIEVKLEDEYVPARIDRSVLCIILNNLIGNAVKFTDEGHVIVHLRADDRFVVLTVSDTGVGIDVEFLPHLFDEFKQESDGLARSHEGSGLGLSITRRLVHLMDGEITVDSIKGKGSRFTVKLPRELDAPRLSNVA